MFKKIFVYTLFFYFLALLQTTSLVGFNVLGMINLISIFVVFINLFEKPRDCAGIYAGFIGGFFSDIFSANLIGQNALIFLFLALFIKIVLRKYVWSPTV